MRLGKALATGTATGTIADETPVPTETGLDVTAAAPAGVTEEPAPQGAVPAR